jgi:hypothetical protein
VPEVGFKSFDKAKGSYFAFIIGIGVLKGYQYKGLTDKKLPKIIMTISIIIITIVTFIIIPVILIFQVRGTISINDLITYYSFNAFISNTIKNYAIAILFTFLGLGGVMNQINAY